MSDKSSGGILVAFLGLALIMFGHGLKDFAAGRTVDGLFMVAGVLLALFGAWTSRVSR